MDIAITNAEDYSIWIDKTPHNELIILNQIYRDAIAIIDTEVLPVEILFANIASTDITNHFKKSRPEIIIFGTGQEHLFLPEAIKFDLYQQHIQVESMNTLSAVNTFNLLTADKRKVWAWLWPLEKEDF